MEFTLMENNKNELEIIDVVKSEGSHYNDDIEQLGFW